MAPRAARGSGTSGPGSCRLSSRRSTCPGGGAPSASRRPGGRAAAEPVRDPPPLGAAGEDDVAGRFGVRAPGGRDGHRQRPGDRHGRPGRRPPPTRAALRRDRTDHGPAPPPASVSSTCCVGLHPARRRPNESATGLAKTSGVSARGRLTTPPPARDVDGSTRFRWSANAPSPVSASADLTCAGVQVGWRCRSSAAAPATCGAAMLVPDSVAQAPGGGRLDRDAGRADVRLEPEESGVGPLEEKDATTSSGPLRVVETAPTVIASGAEAGEPTEPRPKSVEVVPGRDDRDDTRPRGGCRAPGRRCRGSARSPARRATC